MAADKNNNTRRKVVANSNKLCLGTVVSFASVPPPSQSIRDLISLPTRK